MLCAILLLGFVGVVLSQKGGNTPCYLPALPLPTTLSQLPPSAADGWRKIKSFDMLDANEKCPSAWREMTRKKACGRVRGSACDSVYVSTGGNFRQICGTFKAFQWGNTDAFANFFTPKPITIDSTYVDGISITYSEGGNRQHIFTYASGLAERYTPGNWPEGTCPCAGGAFPPPQFVRYADFYCESGNPTKGFDSDQIHCDRLWDGLQCRYDEESCCNPPSIQPWFCRDLDKFVASDIEIRICSDEGTSSEDTALESYELYVR